MVAVAETGMCWPFLMFMRTTVMRTTEYIAVLFRAGLVKFASKPEMLASDNRIIRQFLAGKSKGPIGMDEIAQSDVDVDAEDDDETYEVVTV